MPTNSDALKSLFITVVDTNTGKVKKIATTSDFQVGRNGNPAELDLFGRLVLSGKDYVVSAVNNGILEVSSDDTIVSIINEQGIAVSLTLPANPKNGQIHFIKDASGVASSYPIAPTTLIDGEERLIDSNYGALAIYWHSDSWLTLMSTSGSGGGSSSLPSASFLMATAEPGVPSSREVIGGTGITVTDNGAGSTFDIDLDDTTVTPGSYFAPDLTIDAQGRITAASSSAGVVASYITVTSEASLANERVLSGSGGILLSDGGPGGKLQLSINDNIVATLSGSRFTGPVSASGGLSGSLQQVSPGVPYLAGQGGITITTQSNGQIIISVATGSGGSSFDWIDGGNKLKTTSSVSISGNDNIYADQKSVDVFFYVSGTSGLSGSGSRKSVFGGDVQISGTLTVGTGSVSLTSNNVQFGAFTRRIERSGSDLRFFDDNNLSGFTLTQLAQSGSVSSSLSRISYATPEILFPTGRNPPGIADVDAGPVTWRVGDKLVRINREGSAGRHLIHSASISDPLTWSSSSLTVPVNWPSNFPTAPAVINNVAICYGGRSGSASSNVIFSASIHDLTTWYDTGGRLPANRGYAAAFVGYDSKIYVVAGLVSGGTIQTNTIWSASVGSPTIVTDTGRTGPTTDKNAQCAVVLGDYAFMWDGTGNLWKSHMLDLTQWADTGIDFPAAINTDLNFMVPHGNHLYILGRNNTDGTIWRSHLGETSFTRTGGIVPGNRVLNGCWYYDSQGRFYGRFAGPTTSDNFLFSSSVLSATAMAPIQSGSYHAINARGDSGADYVLAPAQRYQTQWWHVWPRIGTFTGSL